MKPSPCRPRDLVKDWDSGKLLGLGGDMTGEGRIPFCSSEWNPSIMISAMFFLRTIFQVSSSRFDSTVLNSKLKLFLLFFFFFRITTQRSQDFLYIPEPISAVFVSVGSCKRLWQLLKHSSTFTCTCSKALVKWFWCLLVGCSQTHTHTHAGMFLWL